MTLMHGAEEEIQGHGIRPTAIRLLVWRAVEKLDRPFCLYDIEAEIPTLDRSSIFRALLLFAEHHMLHEIDDGSGSCKYCICRCEDKEHHIQHVHFSCTRCGKTFCITEQIIPQVSLPEGFLAEEAEYVIKGLCPKCSKNLR